MNALNQSDQSIDGIIILTESITVCATYLINGRDPHSLPLFTYFTFILTSVGMRNSYLASLITPHHILSSLMIRSLIIKCFCVQAGINGLIQRPLSSSFFLTSSYPGVFKEKHGSNHYKMAFIFGSYR